MLFLKKVLSDNSIPLERDKTMARYITTQAKLHSQSFQNSGRVESETYITELTAEVNYLRALVKTQAELIAELQFCVDPYSQDGNAICNFSF